MGEQVKPQNVVIGQRVQEAKVVLAQNMRREMTTAEAILWTRLWRSGLGVNFRRQQIIDGFIADFYCHSAALVVEVDGLTHDLEYDQERDQTFAERGITTLRFTNQEVFTKIGFVIFRLRQHLTNNTPNPLWLSTLFTFPLQHWLPGGREGRRGTRRGGFQKTLKDYHKSGNNPVTEAVMQQLRLPVSAEHHTRSLTWHPHAALLEPLQHTPLP